MSKHKSWLLGVSVFTVSTLAVVSLTTEVIPSRAAAQMWGGGVPLDGDDFPPFEEGSVPLPVPPSTDPDSSPADPTPALPITFVPEWLPPPPGGTMCAYNNSDEAGLWTVCFPNYGVEYEIGNILPGEKGTVVIPPGSEGLVFKFKVYLVIDGEVVIICSNVMAIPS